jgi:hypothetical protein
MMATPIEQFPRLSSPRKRGPIATGLWNMGSRLRGNDSVRWDST